MDGEKIQKNDGNRGLSDKDTDRCWTHGINTRKIK